MSTESITNDLPKGISPIMVDTIDRVASKQPTAPTRLKALTKRGLLTKAGALNKEGKETLKAIPAPTLAKVRKVREANGTAPCSVHASDLS